MNLSELFILQFMMFAEMLAGYLLCRAVVLKPENRPVFSKAVINLFLPCSIVKSFLSRPDGNVLKDFMIVLTVSLVIQLFCHILSKTLFNRKPPQQKPILKYATLCSNAGFLGNAVAEGVYGEMGMLYGQIYLIPLRIIMWTAGIAYFEGQSDLKSKIRKIISHPCIIAVVIGIVLMITSIPLPQALTRTLSSLGGCSTPLVMVFLGMVLAETGMGHLISKETLRFSILRLILIPAAVLAGCLIFRVDSFITGLSVLLAAMPASTTTSVLAEQYHGDVAFASNIVVVTTIGSILLLPAWVMLLQMF